MSSVLLLGLLMGMRHAIESDHVAAVASIAAQQTGKRHAVKLGIVWGSGHALALFSVCVVFIAFDWGAPDTFSGWLELAVGFMLVWLGIDLIYRVVRERIHFHRHQHGAQVSHLHLHAHRSAPSHAAQQYPVDGLGREHDHNLNHNLAHHPHRHHGNLSLRAFGIGLMHGMAGSAALVVLALGSVQSFGQALVYMALFAVGSIAGMAALSLTITLPFYFSARTMTWGYNTLQCAVGGWTLVMGSMIVADRVPALLS